MKQESEHSHPTFPHIELHPSIPKKQIQRLATSTQFSSQFFTLILYNYLETPKLQEFLETSIEAEGELCLVRKEIKTGNYQFLKDGDKEYEYFLLYMVNENTPLVNEGQSERQALSNGLQQIYELKPILTTLISLSDKVVVFDLDKEKQAFIERTFVESVATCQKIKWQTTFNRVHRLVFIRDCYNSQKMQSKPSQKTLPNEPSPSGSSKLTASTTIDTLQYYSSLSEYKEHTQQQKEKFMHFRSQFELVNDNQFMDRLLREKKVVRKITLKEVLHIYERIMQLMTRPIEEVVLESLLVQFLVQTNDKGSQQMIRQGLGSDKSQKFILNESWKVRYYIQKVYELETVSRLYSTIEQEIFYPETSVHRLDHVHKEIKKYLSSSHSFKQNSLLFSHANFSNFDYIPSFMAQISLSPNAREKLLWKLNRLQKYQQQLHDEAKISPIISADKIFYELEDEEITYWLEKYASKWTEKSLSHLKAYFNRIANQKDHKAIQEFKQQCYKMQERISKVNTSLYDIQKSSIVKSIQTELNSFVEYHNDVIEMKRFSGLGYFWKECGYLLRHKGNVRNKLILFVLILLLALMQKNVIAGLTLGTMAIIVLAIRL